MSKNHSVADYALEFAKRARNGSKPKISIPKTYAESFLLVLAREGFSFAQAALDQITDPELRRIIEAIFFSSVAGASVGATIGFAVGGPAGAQVGACIGGATGLVVGCIALTLFANQHGNDLVLQVE